LTLELFTDAPKDLWSLVDPAQISPVAQVAIFRETKLLIGQHGAGLTNMLWMDQGGTVVEVLPPRPAHDPPFFLNLARACGHRYFSIDQRDDHADIEESRFQTTVRKALRECQILW
jgi:capsular polysaccharide biosynthesis protein